MTIELTVNGLSRRIQVRSGDRLVDVLRRQCSLDSLLPDCLAGRCGRCLVFMDGRLAQSCLIPAFKAKGSAIMSYEALAANADMESIRKVLEASPAKPCEFCMRAKTLAIYDLLTRNPTPEKEEILGQLSMVDCSCSDPQGLCEAVELAADIMAQRKYGRADK